MTPEKLPLAQASLRLLTQKLRPARSGVDGGVCRTYCGRIALDQGQRQSHDFGGD
jgi:hypothetical protein